jgi:hypothetical protein
MTQPNAGTPPVDQFDSDCEWCGVPEGEPCADGCGCHTCENDRALDEDADTWSRR